jgi:glycosyltransferase involved in cell wall biosynthesis
VKIAIIVHGRFHAFDMARELIELGHDVRLLTNYPRQWPARFGVPASHVRSFALHGIVSRLAHRAGAAVGRDKLGEAVLHRWFSRWAAGVLRRDPADAAHCFTGVAEEVLRDRHGRDTIRTIVRGSSHIRVQRRILDDEERRTGRVIDKPSDWMVAREEREYALADLIITMSTFARQSFLAEGVPAAKVVLVPLGVRPALFQVDAPDALARDARIRAGARLRVLTVGTFSLRKGAWDYVDVARRLQGRMDFVFRGDVSADAAPLRREAEGLIRFEPRVPEARLREDYRSADVFYFPTLEDGYAAVLAQAAAAGLPILATTNCGAADFVREEEDGWILPIRRPDLAEARLDWCDRHREALAQVAEAAARPKPSRDWRDRATTLVQVFEQCQAARRGALPPMGRLGHIPMDRSAPELVGAPR